MEFLVIGTKGSHYSQNPILVRVWDPGVASSYGFDVARLLGHPGPLRAWPGAHGLADIGLPT